MKISCGAIFYTFDSNNNIGIILGLEGDQWFPFKGCKETDETITQTAIREIKEETCGLVDIKEIDLEHKFSSKRKIYFIGICEVSNDFVNQFEKKRLEETRASFMEKKAVKVFTLSEAFIDKSVHGITKSSLYYFENKLKLLELERRVTFKPLPLIQENLLSSFHYNCMRKQSINNKFLKNKTIIPV
jgi:hypothetical protein